MDAVIHSETPFVFSPVVGQPQDKWPSSEREFLHQSIHKSPCIVVWPKSCISCQMVFNTVRWEKGMPAGRLIEGTVVMGQQLHHNVQMTDWLESQHTTEEVWRTPVAERRNCKHQPFSHWQAKPHSKSPNIERAKMCSLDSWCSFWVRLIFDGGWPSDRMDEGHRHEATNLHIGELRSPRWRALSNVCVNSLNSFS